MLSHVDGAEGGRAYRSAVRQEQARATRRQVLAAASEVFAAQGYAGATVRAIAGAAGVSVPTVELLFGTKAGVLKAAIDVAIAGDDAPVAVLDRPWAERAGRAGSVEELLGAVAAVIAPAQRRSAGLVLAVLEAAQSTDLAGLRDQLTRQRERTAGWIVDRVTALAPLRPELTDRDAVETVWLLMDPAVFVRLTRNRRWSLRRYQHWFARSVRHLLLPDDDKEISR
jgi:AcrR family transcriptional regulator